MARVAWTGKLRPDKIEQYVDAHAHVWPEVLAMLKEAGIRNYTVYLVGNLAFGYYECDDPANALLHQSRSAVNQRWTAAMAELFEPEVGEHGPTYPPEVFRLD